MLFRTGRAPKRHDVAMAHSAIPRLTVGDPDTAVEFYRHVFGLDVVMDMAWVATLAISGRPTSQLTVIKQNATASANGEVTIEVDDLDVVWDRAVYSDAETVYPRQVEPWGVERFFARDPAGHVVNVMCHRSA
jgi:catechol 2,3-dioxygenase-like lactoylglutathione lyase family enzyme